MVWDTASHTTLLGIMYYYAHHLSHPHTHTHNISQVGDVVYARVETCHKDLDTVLTCMDPHGKASGFGPLTKGYTVHVDSAHARRLLAQPPAAVRVRGKRDGDNGGLPQCMGELVVVMLSVVNHSAITGYLLGALLGLSCVFVCAHMSCNLYVNQPTSHNPGIVCVG